MPNTTTMISIGVNRSASGRSTGDSPDRHSTIVTVMIQLSEARNTKYNRRMRIRTITKTAATSSETLMNCTIRRTLAKMVTT